MVSHALQLGPAPHKDFSDLYEKMSGKGESASGAHLLPAVRQLSTVLYTRSASCLHAPAWAPVRPNSLCRSSRALQPISLAPSTLRVENMSVWFQKHGSD